MEKAYLEQVISLIPERSRILDLGCGTGQPIMAYFIDRGYSVLGVDASPAMLEIARKQFPDQQFLLRDMRKLQLEEQFDAIIAWHSFFHLPAKDQMAMFPIFRKHLKPHAVLVFTSGTHAGEAWGSNGGEPLYHASLSSEQYRDLLTEHGFQIMNHQVEDPNCGGATVWVAQLNNIIQSGI